MKFNLTGDKVFQRFIKNASIVFTGNMMGSVLNLVSFTIMAGQIGPAALAFLTLAQTYANIVNDIFNVQTWESMVMFGSKGLRDNKFSSVIKTNLLIDIISAIVAFLFAFSLVELTVGFMEWDTEITKIVRLYTLSIVLNITSFTTGIPRLFDKFMQVSVINVSVSALKLIAVFVAMQSSQDLLTYVYIFLVADIATKLWLVVFSLNTLRKEHDPHWWKEKIHLDIDQLRFIWWTNLRTIVRLPVRHFDMMIISAVISMEMVGIYRVYKEIASMVKRIQDPINQTIFPEFTKLLANKNKDKTANVAKKTMLLLMAVSSVLIGGLLLTVGFIVENFFGPEYLADINALYALLVVYLLSFITVPINSLFIASGFAKASFLILLLTNSLYLISGYYFGILYGIYGIVIAYTVQLVGNKGLKIYLLKKHKDWGETIR